MSRPAAVAGGAAWLWLPCLIYAAVAGTDALVRFFPDDAFYYLQPAWHLAHDGRAAFDGVHATNGYHPLNFAFVSLLAAGLSKTALLPVTFAVHTLLAFAAAALAVAHFGRDLPRAATTAALVVVASPALLLFVYLSAGLEAGLVVLGTVIVAVALSRAADRRWHDPTRQLQLGGALALLLLSRLDTVVGVGPLAVGVAVAVLRQAEPAAARWRALAAVAGPPVVLLSAYLALNYALTGHLVPVSGHVKSTLVPGDGAWRPSTGGSPWGLAFALLPVAIGLASAVVATRPGANARDDGRRQAVRLTGLATAAFTIYLATSVAHVFRWYFAYPIGGAMVGAAYLADTVPARLTGGGRVYGPVTSALLLAAGSVTTTMCLLWIGSRPASVSFHLWQVAALVNRHGGPAAVTGTMDAGVVGYFGQGRVINLDGLANNFEYLEQFLRTGRLTEYFAREGVTHLLVRDALLANAAAVDAGSYDAARLTIDPRVRLPRDHELFRYRLPGQFAVYYFRLPGTPAP